MHWSLSSFIEDLEFVGDICDICALAHIFKDSQQQVNNIESRAKRTGLYINPHKLMRINANQP